MNPLEVLSFIMKILQLLTLVAGSVSSWYREPSHNKTVGGAPDSLHTQGLALDLVPAPGVSAVAITTAANGLSLYTLIEPTHVHIQDRPLRGRTRAT